MVELVSANLMAQFFDLAGHRIAVGLVQWSGSIISLSEGEVPGFQPGIGPMTKDRQQLFQRHLGICKPNTVTNA